MIFHCRYFKSCNHLLLLTATMDIILVALLISLKSQVFELTTLLSQTNASSSSLRSNSRRGHRRQSVDVGDSQLLPMIYAITPTYARRIQKADLTRLMQTFQHLTRLHWIVVEDAVEPSTMVEQMLNRSGLIYTHLHVKTNKTLVKGRGFPQRNKGLQFLRKTFGQGPLSNTHAGVIYFADDDNTYDLRLFGLIRSTRRLSFGPVGYVARLKIEKPAVSDGKIVGWDVEYARKAKLRSDMAGFALNLQFLLDNPQMEFKLGSGAGYFEKNFLESSKLTLEGCEVFGMDSLTPSGLHEVLVWHTRTANPALDMERKYFNRTGNATDDGWEV